MLRHALARTLRRGWTVLPRSTTLFKFCRMYVNFYNGDDLSDMRLNGERRTLERLLPRCTMAFDVGANVGDWAALALSVNPNLTIHSFEPASATFAQLQARGFPAGQVIANPFALSDRTGEATLYLHANSSDVNSLYDAGVAGEPAGAAASEQAAVTGSEIIRLETLDSYCRLRRIEQIGYLKLDVEGHELSVLRGARDTLARRAVDYVQVEYGTGYLAANARFADVFTLLMEAGYRCHKITPTGLKAWPRYVVAQENFVLSNWLFARDGVEV